MAAATDMTAATDMAAATDMTAATDMAAATHMAAATVTAAAKRSCGPAGERQRQPENAADPDPKCSHALHDDTSCVATHCN